MDQSRQDLKRGSIQNALSQISLLNQYEPEVLANEELYKEHDILHDQQKWYATILDQLGENKILLQNLHMHKEHTARRSLDKYFWYNNKLDRQMNDSRFYQNSSEIMRNKQIFIFPDNYDLIAHHYQDQSDKSIKKKAKKQYRIDTNVEENTYKVCNNVRRKSCQCNRCGPLTAKEVSNFHLKMILPKRHVNVNTGKFLKNLVKPSIQNHTTSTSSQIRKSKNTSNNSDMVKTQIRQKQTSQGIFSYAIGDNKKPMQTSNPLFRKQVTSKGQSPKSPITNAFLRKTSKTSSQNHNNSNNINGSQKKFSIKLSNCNVDSNSKNNNNSGKNTPKNSIKNQHQHSNSNMPYQISIGPTLKVTEYTNESQQENDELAPLNILKFESKQIQNNQGAQFLNNNNNDDNNNNLNNNNEDRQKKIEGLSLDIHQIQKKIEIQEDSGSSYTGRRRQMRRSCTGSAIEDRSHLVGLIYNGIEQIEKQGVHGGGHRLKNQRLVRHKNMYDQFSQRSRINKGVEEYVQNKLHQNENQLLIPGQLQQQSQQDGYLLNRRQSKFRSLIPTKDDENDGHSHPFSLKQQIMSFLGKEQHDLNKKRRQEELKEVLKSYGHQINTQMKIINQIKDQQKDKQTQNQEQQQQEQEKDQQDKKTTRNKNHSKTQKKKKTEIPKSSDPSSPTLESSSKNKLKKTFKVINPMLQQERRNIQRLENYENKLSCSKKQNISSQREQMDTSSPNSLEEQITSPGMYSPVRKSSYRPVKKSIQFTQDLIQHLMDNNNNDNNNSQDREQQESDLDLEDQKQSKQIKLIGSSDLKQKQSYLKQPLTEKSALGHLKTFFFPENKQRYGHIPKLKYFEVNTKKKIKKPHLQLQLMDDVQIYMNSGTHGKLKSASNRQLQSQGSSPNQNHMFSLTSRAGSIQGKRKHYMTQQTFFPITSQQQYNNNTNFQGFSPRSSNEQHRNKVNYFKKSKTKVSSNPNLGKQNSQQQYCQQIQNEIGLMQQKSVMNQGLPSPTPSLKSSKYSGRSLQISPRVVRDNWYEGQDHVTLKQNQNDSGKKIRKLKSSKIKLNVGSFSSNSSYNQIGKQTTKQMIF